MNFNPINNTVVKYFILRGISIAFFVISINYIMLPDDRNLPLFGLTFVFALLFMSLYTNLKPQPHILKCLNKTNTLVSSFLSSFILIGYGVFVLSLYRIINKMQSSLALMLYSALFFVLMSLVYLYLCKKTKLSDKTN